MNVLRMWPLASMIPVACAVLATATGAHAASKCTASKLKASGNLAACELNVFAKDATKGTGVVLVGCQGKHATAFSKAERTADCLGPTGDQATIQSRVDAFAGGMNASTRDANPLPSRCIAAKLKAAGKKASCRLGEHARATSKGVAVDTTKLERCSTKFTAASTKAERLPDCGSAAGDTAAIEAQVDGFVTDVNAEAGGATTTTTSTTTTTTLFPTCSGACTTCGSCGTGFCVPDTDGVSSYCGDSVSCAGDTGCAACETDVDCPSDRRCVNPQAVCGLGGNGICVLGCE